MDPRFTPSLISMATASHARFYPRGPFISIILAQWAIESAYGARYSGTNNPFGIKATASQIAAGQATLCRTREVIAGRSYLEELYFANYPTLEHAFDAHGTLLTSPWYRDCIAAPTADAYATALYTDHYATAPDYADDLRTIMRDNDLYSLDKARPNA